MGSFLICSYKWNKNCNFKKNNQRVIHSLIIYSLLKHLRTRECKTKRYNKVSIAASKCLMTVTIVSVKLIHYHAITTSSKMLKSSTAESNSKLNQSQKELPTLFIIMEPLPQRIYFTIGVLMLSNNISKWTIKHHFQRYSQRKR